MQNALQSCGITFQALSSGGGVGYILLLDRVAGWAPYLSRAKGYVHPELEAGLRISAVPWAGL